MQTKKQIPKQIPSACVIKYLVMLVTFISLTACGGSSKNSDSNNGVKTNFSTCEELKAYVEYYSYSNLKEMWGEGSIGEPWDCSAVGEFDMKVDVKWNNIKCNGRAVEIQFTNSHLGLADAFEKSPNLFDGIFCDEYKTPYVEPKSEAPAPQNETRVEENTTPVETKTVEPTPQQEVKEVIKTGTATAIVTRAYFYDEPNLDAKRKQFIIKNQSMTFTNSENGFIYGSYTNQKNQITTEGWMLVSDFTISSTQ